MVGSTTLVAMVRVRLNPSATACVVYVVPINLLQAPIENRSLAQKSWISPIQIEVHDLLYLHREDESPLKAVYRFRTDPDDPVANHCARTNFWLTGGKCAPPEERIGSKTKITSDNIRIYLQQLYRLTSHSGLLGSPVSGVSH